MWIETASSWNVNHCPFYLQNINSEDSRFRMDFKVRVQSLRPLGKALLNRAKGTSLITHIWSQHWECTSAGQLAVCSPMGVVEARAHICPLQLDSGCP